ncbi:MAG TPA: cysteine desulfurase family protein [Alphaproteobacteria bacterium]|nr:cysteine desulfurase family protein [Alphaproteobacteria bacterium]
MIYLDYNASVPLRPSAQNALIEALDMTGNSSSVHHAGRQLRSLIDGARKSILQATGAQQLVFTSGGTEANALALSGLGSIPILVSTIEHDSVLKSALNAHNIPVTHEGIIDLESLEKILSSFDKPGLLSIMLVNNETGVIQPLQEATRLAQLKGWKVHTDASQAPGHIPFSFGDLGVDMMTISSHKCGGPVGIGALLLKPDVQLKPLIPGGGQEYGMRSGTLSAPLTLGFAAALTEALRDESFMTKQLWTFQQKIEAALPEAIVYGKKDSRVSNVLSLGMPGVTAEIQLMALDLNGIAVSAGAACSSGKMKTSHVLAAMGVCPEEAQCAIRVSMGWKTQEDEVDAFIQAWKNIYSKPSLKEVF